MIFDPLSFNQCLCKPKQSAEAVVGTIKDHFIFFDFVGRLRAQRGPSYYGAHLHLYHAQKHYQDKN